MAVTENGKMAAVAITIDPADSDWAALPGATVAEKLASAVASKT